MLGSGKGWQGRVLAAVHACVLILSPIPNPTYTPILRCYLNFPSCLRPAACALPLQLAEEEEFEAKRKELEEQASPVFAKMYQGAGGAGGLPGGMPGGMPDSGAAAGAGGAHPGPTVEEVD